jgi:hypothetical protein
LWDSSSLTLLDYIGWEGSITLDTRGVWYLDLFDFVALEWVEW